MRASRIEILQTMQGAAGGTLPSFPFKGEARTLIPFSSVTGIYMSEEATTGGAVTTVPSVLPPSNALRTSSSHNLPFSVPATPISPLWLPFMQVDNQGPREAPAVSADLPLLTSPITSAPPTLQSQRGSFPLLVKADGDYQSNRTRAAADQSAFSGVNKNKTGKQNVAAETEAVKNNDSLVTAWNPEVISIDDSDGEDANFLLPQESLAQRTVTASIQTERYAPFVGCWLSWKFNMKPLELIFSFDHSENLFVKLSQTLIMVGL